MYYLAYGSNLNVEQMSFRCPDAVKIGTAVIKDYRLMFKGSKTGAYLTIEEAPGYEVPVGVWRVTGADIEALNRYEGYPTFYYKKAFNVLCSDGRRHKAFAYIMHEDRPLGLPGDWYIDVCLQGYRDFGFVHTKPLIAAYDFSKEGIA